MESSEGEHKQGGTIKLPTGPDSILYSTPSTGYLKKQYEKSMSNGNISMLKQCWEGGRKETNFKSAINYILDNWWMYRYDYQRRMEKLLNIFEARTRDIPENLIVFPGIRALKEKLERVTQIRPTI